MPDSSGQRLHIQIVIGMDGDSVQYRVLEPGDVVRIGRLSECDIVMDHPRVSRSHATVFFEGGVWQYSSTGANGSYIDDESVTHVLIEDGTSIRLGRDGGLIEFRFPEDDDSDTGSITAFIGGMKAGDEESVRGLWAHCFASVARIARNQMSGTARRMTDEEDVAASVFESLYFSTVQGKLPDLSNRESMWRLIVVMTRRKVADYVNREKALKRGGGKVRGDSIGPPDSSGGAFDHFVSEAPSPMSIAMIEEETTRLLELLPSEEHRKIALCRLEGNTVTETAELLELSIRTVERRLMQIRTAWDDEMQNTGDSQDGNQD
jgi:DNA-directed RNA polymerase specialized sigma24 family protein